MSKSLARKTIARQGESLDAAAILGAEDILQQDLLRAVPVVTPEWKPGSAAYIAELSAEERDEYETLWVQYQETYGDEESNVGFRAFTVAYCLCDKDRTRLFTTEDKIVAAAGVIRKRNAKTTSRLFNTASRVNGLTKADIDTLEKNSVATPSEPEHDAGNGESHSV